MTAYAASLAPADCRILTVKQVAARLGVTGTHIAGLVEEGRMDALDMRSRGVTRRTLRIPVECYCEYVLASLPNMDAQRAFLRALPPKVAHAIYHHLAASQENPFKTAESREGVC